MYWFLQFSYTVKQGVSQMRMRWCLVIQNIPYNKLMVIWYQRQLTVIQRLRPSTATDRWSSAVHTWTNSSPPARMQSVSLCPFKLGLGYINEIKRIHLIFNFGTVVAPLSSSQSSLLPYFDGWRQTLIRHRLFPGFLPRQPNLYSSP